ncbi:NF038132 family protein [Pseudoduganella lutea]|uniref:PEP-CTERM sorting domain-containing protein n=1 Tax=Pseudoduganella lutea TaxID=321985 RepID=A0A4P6L5A4_9BURK|nr:NF038132 family protein [Pseudoduganella lutea]QBE66108.1 PEP-CTERM sorting domain-containing protein [Pseudoduganella lutea]
MNTGRLVGIAACLAGLFGGGSAAAKGFENGLPQGWQCQGNCGTLAADGDVTLAPDGGSAYGYVSSENGVTGVSLPGVGTADNTITGSRLVSNLFNATAGQALDFKFNYISSDGADYTDYAWARLLDAQGGQVALLFTARTSSFGSAVPGFGMPAAAATLTPAQVNIVAGGPTWSPLGFDSGECFDAGCGYTGWVQSTYSIAAAGQYYLEFGVTNWDDELYQSGLAFDGVTLDGVPLPVPEPATYGMMLGGLGLLAAWRRRASR